MSEGAITVEQFRALALNALAFLETRGFRRAPALEATSPTTGTVVFLGTHVGLVFSLDVRDQCVDAQVVRIQNGAMKRNWEGGYSSDLFSHLVKHAGYRGSPAGPTARHPRRSGVAAVQEMIDGWAALLKNAGSSLLDDRPDSLPV